MHSPIVHAPLKSRALIALSGEDWRSFLQGLITQDVETLKPGEIRFGGLLTPQGRLLYDLFVVGREDGGWLDVAAEHRDAVVQRLSIYRLRAKVGIAADETPVSALFFAHPGEGRDPAGVSGRARESDWAPAFAGASGVWGPDPRLPALGWRGYGATPPAGAQAAGDDAYEAHRLALGVPGPADWGSETTYPIEACFDLLAGVDFKKGCFVGQETTSRMKRRGQIKTRMLPLVFDGPAPARGTEVLAGDLRAGEVLAGRDGRAMALLRLDRIEGAALTADGRPVRVERPAWMTVPEGAA